MAIEVKNSDKVNASELKGLVSFGEDYPEAQLLFLYRGMEKLKKGKNIASTHALFRSSRSEIIELIELYGYTLILDEVMDVVEQIPLKKDDLQNMLKIGLVEISENGYLKWIDKENCSQYDNIKEKI